MSLALLEAVRTDKLHSGAHVVALYNGIEIGDGPARAHRQPQRHPPGRAPRTARRAKDLRKLDTQVPLETLRAVVDLATEIGREGREGKPVGTMFVVGDTRKVLAMSPADQLQPVPRLQPRRARHPRPARCASRSRTSPSSKGPSSSAATASPRRRACTSTPRPKGITLSKGLGTRHWAAAAISRKTKAIAVAVSQSSGTVRIFQNGEVVLHIEPLARPMVWDKFRLEVQDANGVSGPAVPWSPAAGRAHGRDG